jgi:glycosyltransferase involved in cell wall biosynthesis
MDFDGDEYVREVKQKLDECRGRVLLRGAYTQEELPSRLRDVAWVVVPSIWWENSPLVIQEAFMHRRPVITSNIGGMAEKVTDGVDGLHFRAGDPVHLAEVLAQAAGNDELWQRLHSGISEILSLTEAVDELETIYRKLRREKATPRAV